MRRKKRVRMDDELNAEGIRARNRGIRIASARLFTDIGWIAADIHVPAHVRLIDHVSKGSPFLTLTSVFLEGRAKPLDFFALKKSAVSFMAVMDLEELDSAKSMGSQVRHQMSCILADGAVTGEADLHSGVRVSDFFARHDGFVLMFNCHYRTRDRWSHKHRTGVDATIILNTQKIIALSEIPIDSHKAPKE